MTTALADLGRVPGPHPPTGPDSFVSTQNLQNVTALGVPARLRGLRTSTGNPGSATALVLALITPLNNKYNSMTVFETDTMNGN